MIYALDIFLIWVLIVSLYRLHNVAPRSPICDELYLDPDSVEFGPDEKNYLSIDDLRDDLLTLPIYHDWISWRGRSRVLFMGATERSGLIIAQIEIPVGAAMKAWVDVRVTGYMKRAFGGNFR